MLTNSIKTVKNDLKLACSKYIHSDFLKKKFLSALLFCKETNDISNENYIVDELTHILINQKIEEMYVRQDDALAEILELLFYVSGNNRRYQMIRNKK